MSIVLIGVRGSGKSTIGRKLADRLWETFVDVDDLIVSRAGKSIREIFEQEGEAHFRDLETDAVREVAGLKDHVIGLGGGSLGREENRRVLKESGHKLIFLRCDPQELLRRLGADPQRAATRPNLTPLGGGLEEINQLLADREPIYRAAMHAELDVTHLTPDEAVVYVVKLL